MVCTAEKDNPLRYVGMALLPDKLTKCYSFELEIVFNSLRKSVTTIAIFIAPDYNGYSFDTFEVTRIITPNMP